MGKYKYYAVAVGKTPGIYDSWNAAHEQIFNFEKPYFRGFQTLEEARAFMLGRGAEALV